MPSIKPYWSSQTSLANLTIEQKNWLKKHSHFSLGIDNHWSPFEFIDKNNDYSGVSSEYIAILQEKMGVVFEPDYSKTWGDAFKAIKKGDIDVIPAIVKTEKRAQSMIFTEPYISLSSVILTRRDSFYVQGINDLVGKKVGVIGGYVFESILKEKHPKIKIARVGSVKEGIELVEAGEIDAFIDALATINHELNNGNHKDIIVAAFTPYPLELSMAVSKKLAPLAKILDKALVSITTKQKSRIANNWLTVEVNLESNFKTFLYWGLPVGSIFIMIILIVLRANRRMQFEIMERKKTEALLEKAKQKAETANQTKDNFLANMSHEIRTPMNAVVGMSYLLEKSGLNEQQKEYQETLNSSAESLLVLIDDILDLSKVEAGKLELEYLPFNLTEILKNIENQVRLIIDENKIELVTKVSSDIPRLLYGDSNRLRQVILNIVNNAAKFTDKGKIEITVEVKSKHAKTVEIEFCVSDTGIGMDANQQKKLFQNYSQADSSTTRKYGGTGLGLAISKQLCELMGGKIWLKSHLEVGSQFYFTVKLEYKDITETNIDKELPQARNEFDFLKGKKILLVDDNDVNLMVARMILSNAGMEIVTARNGQEAIDHLNEFTFDAVLMDIQMPIMDGYTATKYIRKEMSLTDLPIIAVSANVMKKDLQKSMASGMNAHIGKPLNVNKLLTTLASKISN
ncbi:MAG: transporter substrate-binding domain-containing protein [Enterobacterales bacterium]|nr:transporter substrate-binding domain-containing protein [Enterobacterales bacterium]